MSYLGDGHAIIYVLVDPRDNLIRYVGMSTNLSFRYETHVNRRSSGKQRQEWVDDLQSDGFDPVLVPIEFVPSDYDQTHDGFRRDREDYWIRLFSRYGCPLTNVNTRADRRTPGKAFNPDSVKFPIHAEPLHYM